MKKIHMIGNAHLDLVWYWRWQEGFGECKATFLSMLQRLNENDDVVFTSSSAQLYQWVEENAPEMFHEIKKRIEEGRWIICGGMWVQPDCNIPCGEAFARQALLAQNYFLDRFGVTANVGYNVDSFGHNGMLPQILRLSGMDSYVFLRPGPHEKNLPGHNFLWESEDGSRVMAYRIPFAYNSFGDIEAHIDACCKDADSNIEPFMCFYGVGNHGGGPTKENIAAIRRYQEANTDNSVIFSDPITYFKELQQVQDLLPVYHGELQHHAVGCYSAHSEIKAANRRTENALLRAEKFCSMAAMIGAAKYPDDFDEAWKRLLFNQFHDILAGTGSKEAYRDALIELGEAQSIAAHAENNALQAISFSIDIEHEEGLQPLVVFNPHAFPVKEVVEYETSRFYRKGMLHVYDNDGDEIPCQEIDAYNRAESRRRVAFLVEIPAYGYALYKLGANGGEENQEDKQEEFVLENELVRISFDPETGGIKSFFQKQEEIEYLSMEAGIPVMIDDKSDTWSHDVLRYDGEETNLQFKSIRLVEAGRIRNSIRIVHQYENSVVTQTFSLCDKECDLRVHVRINWQAQQKCLKLRFPLNLHDCKATYSIPFGSISRPANGDEESMLSWMDLSGMKNPWDCKRICGVSIINNAKYSADIHKNIMSLTVLRSPVYAHHLPYALKEDVDYDYIDQGFQEFDYIIAPHEGTWENSRVIQKADILNQPLVVVAETYHRGTLPKTASFIKAEQPNVQITCIKKAEKSDDWVLRLYEYEGKKTAVSIDLPLCKKRIEAELKPYEIVSFMFNNQAKGTVQRVQFLETAENVQ